MIQWFLGVWEYFAAFGIGGIYTVAVVYLAYYRKDFLWNATINDHLGSIQKTEIDKRDNQIAMQSNEIEEANKTIKALREKVRLMAKLCEQEVEIAGYTHKKE